MNQQEAAQKLATTILVHKLFTDKFEDLDREAVLEAVRGGVSGWFAQTRRQSTKDNAWYQAWEEAKTQLEIQKVGIDAYYSEPKEASEVEASEVLPSFKERIEALLDEAILENDYINWFERQVRLMIYKGNQ